MASAGAELDSFVTKLKCFMKAGCQASINVVCKEGKMLKQLQRRTKVLHVLFLFSILLETNEKSSNKRRQERCKAVRVAAEQAAEAKEKDANDFRKVEEDTVKPDSCNGSESIITKHYY